MLAIAQVDRDCANLSIGVPDFLNPSVREPAMISTKACTVYIAVMRNTTRNARSRNRSSPTLAKMVGKKVVVEVNWGWVGVGGIEGLTSWGRLLFQTIVTVASVTARTRRGQEPDAVSRQ